jgi:glutamate--cysteine ligase
VDDPSAPLTRTDAIAHVHATVGQPSSDPPCAGIEQEWHTFCLPDPTRHLHPEEVLGPIEAAGPLPHGSRVTIEPGGQVELATAPGAPWWTAVDAVRIDGATIREALAVAGIACIGAGIDPFRSPARTLRTSRYSTMEAYFDGFGPAGRRMMGATASLQVNVNHGADIDTMTRRWKLAHRIGPALAAAFACSPSRTHRSARLATWAEMDPTRTSAALQTGDVGDDWAAYVLAARVMLLHDDSDTCSPVPEEITFGEWIERGIELPGGRRRRPTAEDLGYHCTTLFPPVRARGWLELRWLDGLPAGVADTAVAAVSALLLDDEAGDRASRVCDPVAEAWGAAAMCGPTDRALAAAAVDALHAAAEAIDRSDAPGTLAESVADAADRWPARGRCPADDLEDRLRRGAGVMDLADPPWEVHRWS